MDKAIVKVFVFVVMVGIVAAHNAAYGPSEIGTDRATALWLMWCVYSGTVTALAMAHISTLIDTLRTTWTTDKTRS